MNIQHFTKPLWIALLMLAAAGLTVAATPTKRMADAGRKLDLKNLIPKSFGDWRIDPRIVPIGVSPDVQAKLDRIYSQTLGRTYIDSRGYQVMLSIAYGGDQSDGMRAHRPEVCYAAQGFEVIQSMLGQLVTEYGVVPVRRLVAVNGHRNEPITYWMVVGDKVALSGLGQKLAQLSYGLTGTVPDGMLVRVSAIDRDKSRSFAIQEDFVRDMLSALSREQRVRVAGRFGA